MKPIQDQSFPPHIFTLVRGAWATLSHPAHTRMMKLKKAIFGVGFLLEANIGVLADLYLREVRKDIAEDGEAKLGWFYGPVTYTG